MPEVRETKVKQVDQRCPVCKEGWMRPTGIVMTGEPTHFEHQCTSCEWKNMYTERYPYVIYNENPY